MVSMQVGVQGRVILGPAGAPGTVDVPMRFAVVHEGPTPKTIVTKLDRVPVTIPPDDANVLFTHDRGGADLPDAARPAISTPTSSISASTRLARGR